MCEVNEERETCNVDEFRLLWAHQHHHHHHHRKTSIHPTNEQSHSSHHIKKLIKSATASIPLSQYDKTIDSPSSLFKHPIAIITNDNNTINTKHEIDESPTKINVPCIITPATPLPSPGAPTAEQLDRRCSFYRGRKQLAHEDTLKSDITYDDNNLIEIGHEDAQYDDEYHIVHTTKQTVVDKLTDSECCDSEHHSICTCDHSEVKCMRILIALNK